MTKEFTRLFLLATALIFLCSTALPAAEILTGQPLVVIDPGHDREAPGLLSRTGLRESDLTLALAREVAGLLASACRVQLTRTADTPRVPDTSRVTRANHLKADLYLSIHLHETLAARPLIYYFSRPEKSDPDTWQTRALMNSEASKALGARLAEAIRKTDPATRPAMLSGPLTALEGLNMPGVLIEPFALSQAPESPERLIPHLKFQALPIADGILAFFKDKIPGV